LDWGVAEVECAFVCVVDRVEQWFVKISADVSTAG
jgi:hypothetical protein